jgi:predicted HTH transcriptional regulator
MTSEPQNQFFLDLINHQKECEWLEFKSNNSDPQEVGEYLSALSNSACYHNVPFGYLIYGVEDGSKKIIGTNFFPKSTKKGNQELENWLATQLNPRIDFNIFEFVYDGKALSIFRIEATKNMPVSFRGTPYIRIGSYKKPLDEHPEVERKIWKKGDQYIFEKELAVSKVSADRVIQIIDFVTYFELINLPLPADPDAILERLVQDKVIVPDGKLYSITNLGALLFAKDIESFEKLSRKAIRVIIYIGNNRIKTKKEQIGSKGIAVGFQGLIKYLEDQLPTVEEIGTALRKNVSVYPILAIRELVANAIIHQDFSVTGVSPMVEIFDNRIEITNPGKPLIDPLRFVDHSPQSRNEFLARFMRRLNICEERGSGIDKVVFECEYYQLPAPEIIVGDSYTRVILHSYKTLRQMDKQDKIRACYLHACLKYVSGEHMTNQSLRERFAIDEKNYPMASRIISDSIDSGLIKDYDPESKSKKYAKYVPFWV